jgi:hypothetical protein
MDYVKNIKTSFANIGAYSSEDSFIRGDPEGPIEWISSEAEAFEEILSDRGEVCGFSGARGVAAILEKAGCEHVKTLAQAEATLSIDDTKDPSAEANLICGKKFTDIWENGGRGMAHEICTTLSVVCRPPPPPITTPPPAPIPPPTANRRRAAPDLRSPPPPLAPAANSSPKPRPHARDSRHPAANRKSPPRRADLRSPFARPRRKQLANNPANSSPIYPSEKRI